MYWQFIKHLFIGYLFTLLSSGISLAASTDATWNAWFTDQINQHPEVVAAKETMNAALSMAKNRERPLYNPEFEAEFEHEGQDNNYRVGFSQAIDWQGKRQVRRNQAAYSQGAARSAFEHAQQQKATEALRALIEWQAASQRAELARNQEAQLSTLLELIKDRQQAGDLGQIDAELAFLGISKNLNDAAHAQARLSRAQASLNELFLNWSNERTAIPESVLASAASTAGQRVDQHPSVKAAKAEWTVLQHEADLSRRESKPDPAFGLDAGKTGDDDVIALTFSLPLNLRNDYSAKTRAAEQEALSAQAQYLAIRRKSQFAIAGSRAAMQEFEQRFDRWQHIMKGRSESSKQLLKKQWLSGDLSTSEYLLALQQRTDGLIAGIDLRTQFQLSRIEWLSQTGQINTLLQ